MNYKLSISYKGTNYHGFAKQNSVITIEQVICDTLEELFNLKVKLFGSGRTDRFVHAYKQIINIKHAKLNYEPSTILKALNAKLPNDILVNNCEIVPDNFHARFLAKKKTYIYKMNIAPEYDLFHQELIYQYNKEIDFNKLDKFINVIIGEHNFLSFSTSELNDTIRTIYNFEYEIIDNTLILKITGNGFLRNMVRMIVGCFLNYNESNITLEDIQSYLNNPKKGSVIRKEKGCGLYLYNVEY